MEESFLDSNRELLPVRAQILALNLQPFFLSRASPPRQAVRPLLRGASDRRWVSEASPRSAVPPLRQALPPPVHRAL